MNPRGRVKTLRAERGPLERLLRGQVGRPWNKVFSELRQRLDRGSAAEREVLSLVDRLVTTRAQIIDGRPCTRGGEWERPGQPLRAGGFYVCPTTGLLREVRRRPVQTQRPVAAPPAVRIDDCYQCHWRDGEWYLLTMAPLPPATRRGKLTLQDAWLGVSIAGQSDEGLRKVYGPGKYARSVRRLSKRELAAWPIPWEWK